MQLNPDRLIEVIAYAKQTSLGKPRVLKGIERAAHLLREGRFRYNNRTGTLTVCGSGQELYIATANSCQCRAFTQFNDGCCRHRIAVRLLRLYHDATGFTEARLVTAAPKPPANVTPEVALTNEIEGLAVIASQQAIAANNEEPRTGDISAPLALEPTTHEHYCTICGVCWDHSDDDCGQGQVLPCLECFKDESVDTPEHQIVDAARVRRRVCSLCYTDVFETERCLSHKRAPVIELTPQLADELRERRFLSDELARLSLSASRKLEAEDRENSVLIKRPIKPDVKIGGISI